VRTLLYSPIQPNLPLDLWLLARARVRLLRIAGFVIQKAQHLTKNPGIPLFMRGLDGEVSAKHLTRHLTKHLTIWVVDDG